MSSTGSCSGVASRLALPFLYCLRGLVPGSQVPMVQERANYVASFKKGCGRVW